MDGDTAEGQGTYLQALAFDGQAMWTAGRYRIDFLRVDGAWKIRISASRTSSSLRMMKAGYHTYQQERDAPDLPQSGHSDG